MSPASPNARELTVVSDLNRIPTETICGNAVDGCVLNLCLLPRVVDDAQVAMYSCQHIDLCL